MSDSDAQAQGGGTQTGFEDFEEPAVYETNIGDTLRYRNGYIVVEGINRNATVQNIPRQEGDVIVGLKVKVHAADGETYEAEPVFLIRDGNQLDLFKDVEEQGIQFRFSNIDRQRTRLHSSH